MLLRRLLPLLATLSLGAAPPPAATSLDAMMRMAEQFEAADRDDFQRLATIARDCNRQRNFACADAQMAKAAKVLTNSKDRATYAALQSDIAAEKEAVRREEVARREEEERQAAHKEACENRCPFDDELRACLAYQIAPRSCHLELQQESANTGAEILSSINKAFGSAARMGNIGRQSVANVVAAIEARKADEAAQRERMRPRPVERSAPSQPQSQSSGGQAVYASRTAPPAPDPAEATRRREAMAADTARLKAAASRSADDRMAAASPSPPTAGPTPDSRGAQTAAAKPLPPAGSQQAATTYAYRVMLGYPTETPLASRDAAVADTRRIRRLREANELRGYLSFKPLRESTSPCRTVRGSAPQPRFECLYFVIYEVTSATPRPGNMPEPDFSDTPIADWASRDSGN